MSTHTDVDVIIIGYGPVGQYLAYKLGRLGWTSACVERFPGVYSFPRAVHFDDETARLFQSIGLDPDTNPVIQQYDNIYRWVNADREPLLELDWRGVGRSGWHTSNFFYQPDLEREINKIVSTEGRATVFRGWEAVEVHQDDAGATVLARRYGAGPDAETHTFRGRYAVGADGANSFVRDAMGVTTTDLGFEFDWLIVDMFPHEPMHFDTPAWQWCRPDGPTTIVPGGAPHRRRWEFMRMPGESVEQLNTPEEAWRRVGEFGLTPANSVMERHVMYTFRARWCDEWRKGRLFLAGDAAHLMPPFAGQGMCAGIRDAENLLWKLDAVLGGKAGDALLDTYGPERTQHVRYYIELSMGLGQVICVTDPEAVAARDAQLKAVLADPTLAPPPPTPPHLGEGVTGDHPQAGFPSVQGTVTVDGISGKFDDVLGYGWTVIARPGALTGLDQQGTAWARDFGFRFFEVGPAGTVDTTAAIRDDDGTYGSWLDELGADVAVVRPDHYLYDACATGELDAVLTRLRSALRADVPVA